MNFVAGYGSDSDSDLESDARPTRSVAASSTKPASSASSSTQSPVIATAGAAAAAATSAVQQPVKKQTLAEKRPRLAHCSIRDCCSPSKGTRLLMVDADSMVLVPASGTVGVLAAERNADGSASDSDDDADSAQSRSVKKSRVDGPLTGLSAMLPPPKSRSGAASSAKPTATPAAATSRSSSSSAAPPSKFVAVPHSLRTAAAASSSKVAAASARRADNSDDDVTGPSYTDAVTGPYSDVTGPYTDVTGPYTDVTGPYSDVTGPYAELGSDLTGPYPDETQAAGPAYGAQALPQPTYVSPLDLNMSEQDLLRLEGRKRTGRMGLANIQIVDADASSVMTDEWRGQVLDPLLLAQANVKVNASSRQKSRHQLTYLAQQSKADEARMLLNNERARAGREASRNMYGF
ncbi:hypothetical protein CAOG_00870 [Capsaspora owczarzaki ATCC 30864]|uniref:Proline-rich protein PRCC n=1 Tax=Capsaspora owczarzaki (strain ATCC 30864) TaxID=595528 RepID=A0A0D2VHF3_CAPO3|nr:hypothetical protein CAOG_00870 [Capsaspora owczarzaki ATCC 30864]KJE89392.1 hypothetical protein CAOG_000870 [Capsaspora owczarzaki ATCC 30864]|eukprot:XP_004365741.1 hypothetical protein CAOG_00870 [Capsaspora owczarzaki ATCC 30864]